MVGADEALKLLENKVRRQILERLVREPHYPLQLAKQIGVSQQAIMKHLKLLEMAEFVDSEMVPSEKGGPPRRIYLVQRSFSMRIDLGPDLFTVEQRSLPRGGPMRLSGIVPTSVMPVAESISGRKRIPFGEAVGLLGELSQALDKLDSQRDALISLHQHIKRCASKAIDSDFEHYEQRHLVHNMLENPRSEIDLGSLAKELQMGSSQAEALMDEVRGRLMRTIAERSGHTIAAPRDAKLPWWAAIGYIDD